MEHFVRCQRVEDFGSQQNAGYIKDINGKVYEILASKQCFYGNYMSVGVVSPGMHLCTIEFISEATNGSYRCTVRGADVVTKDGAMLSMLTSDLNADTFLHAQRKLKFRPGVGVFVLDFNRKLVVLGKRKSNKYDDGTWCLPGGGIEWGENIDDASVRETYEECGLRGEYIGQLVTHTYMDYEHDSFHLTVYTAMLANAVIDRVKVAEPDKCYEWRWWPIDSLPQPLAYPCTTLAARTLMDKFYPDPLYLAVQLPKDIGDTS